MAAVVIVVHEGEKGVIQLLTLLMMIKFSVVLIRM